MRSKYRIKTIIILYSNKILAVDCRKVHVLYPTKQGWAEEQYLIIIQDRKKEKEIIPSSPYIRHGAITLIC